MACHRAHVVCFAVTKLSASWICKCVMDSTCNMACSCSAANYLLRPVSRATNPAAFCLPHCALHVVQLDTPKLQLAHKLVRVRAGAILFPTYRMHKRYLLPKRWLTAVQWSPRCQAANPTGSALGNIRSIIIANIIIINVLRGAASSRVTLGAA